MIETRDYQQRIIQRTLDVVEQGARFILIESACGSGKTVMGHLIAQRLHEKYGYKSGWTSMRRHLLHQAEAENNAKIGHEHIEYFSTFTDDPPTGIDVLIDDEAQHSASATSTALYNRLQPKVCIGLTATPIRTDRMKLCYSHVVKDAGVRALIDSGYLSPFHQYLFDGDWRPSSVAELYLSDPDRWGKSVIYFMTLADCYDCASMLCDGGISCDVVHGSSDQDAQIAAFERDELQVLLNVVVLTEGFNSPSLQTVFVRPGSRSPIIQMAGRALRRYPGKTHAQIVQNTASKWPFTKVASAEAKFVLEDGQWRQRGFIGKRVRAAQVNTLLAIPQISVSMPRFLRCKNRRNPLAMARSEG